MYIERRCKAGKYSYLVQCPSCDEQRWQSHTKAGRCHQCAGKESYSPATKPRHDQRKIGDGYITKQGYHLVFRDGAYVPAQRLPFPNIPPDWVVHHIDGDKLHNELRNLHPCSKANHRLVHAQLEKLSYLLIQHGLIEFSGSTYSLSQQMKEIVLKGSKSLDRSPSIGIDGESIALPDSGRISNLTLKTK